jgi:hypothetical protein
MLRRLPLVVALGAPLPVGLGCNTILGIDNNHTLAPGGTSGTAGTGGAAGGPGTGGTAVGPSCSVDGAVMDAGGVDASTGTTCGFIMPNPASAPGDLPNRASYTKNGAAHTVTDNVTGLTWEANVDQTTYLQDEAVRHCQSKGAGWRLPSRLELVSLVDFTVPSPGPTISAAQFGSESVWSAPMIDNDYRKFWTSSHAAFSTATGWEVDFSTGSTHQTSSQNYYKARCVSGTPCRCPATRYQVQGAQQDEVYDAITGLIWQRAYAGSTVWSNAASYCPAGWRLPTPTELPTIVDETKESPATDVSVFPGTPGEPFWTSFPQAGSADGGAPTFAWYVMFAHGHSDVDPSSDPTCTAGDPTCYQLWVRCVR